MKIGCATMILLRMEISHLEEWLVHLHHHEFEQVWIYYETQLMDPQFANKPGDTQWLKKPDNGFHLELTDEQVMAEFERICKHSPVPAVYRPVTMKQENIGARQHSVGNKAHKELKALGYDWMAFLDVDEYLVTSSLKDSLQSVPSYYPEARMVQKVFDSRWKKQKPLKVAEISHNYGYLDVASKYFMRPTKVRAFGGIHDSTRHHNGGVWIFDPERLRYHHFRGLPPAGASHPKLGGIKKYANLRRRPPQPADLSHVV